MNRQRQNEAQDVATLNSNYNATLYDNLCVLIIQRDQNRLALMNQAQGVAGSMYDRWKAEDDALAAKAAGGGGGGDDGSGGGSRRRRSGSGEGTDPGYGLDITNPITPVGDLNKTKVPVENKVIPGKATYKPTSMNADWLNKRTQYTR